MYKYSFLADLNDIVVETNGQSCNDFVSAMPDGNIPGFSLMEDADNCRTVLVFQTEEELEFTPYILIDGQEEAEVGESFIGSRPPHR